MFLPALKPLRNPVWLVVGIVVGSVLFNLGLGRLGGWGQDPWWQGALRDAVFCWVFVRAWTRFTQPSGGEPKSSA